jgi:hypothetical protein
VTRTLTALIAATLAAGMLAGCGPPGAGRASDAGPEQTELELTSALSPEGTALAALGFSPEQLVTEDPVVAADPEPDTAGPRWRAWRERRAATVMLRRHMLHGEIVVQTVEGTRTVLVQRGEVTDVSDTSLTVTSTDGFAQTWVFGDRMRVIESRATIAPRELTVGSPVGVAGVRADGDPTARVVIIPQDR